MRDIQFRGKGLNGEWYHGNLAILKQKIDIIEPGTYISNSAGLPFAYQVRPETVGEFTGLYSPFADCGLGIYEQDILELFWEGHYPLYGIVEWKYPGWFIKAGNKTYAYGYEGFLCQSEELKIIKILGNIFDDMALLLEKTNV